jgi:phage gpG-like protein
MAARAEFMEPVMESMLVSFHEVEAAKFDAEGPGWAPLAESTITSRIALGFGSGPILERTGDLRDSLDGTGAFNVSSSWQLGWESYSTVPYATFHQTGTPKMPARPPVHLTPTVIALWYHMIERYLMGGHAEGIALDNIAAAI